MSGARGVVLVVDDNQNNRLVAEGHLVAAGYEVVMAASGAEGLACFSAGAFDLVLLDLLMPGMDGFETCRRLRALPSGDETPVLFLTALSDRVSHQRALESGADDYLTKPIQGVELLLRVRSLVRIKRLVQDLRSHRDALLVAQEQRRRLTRMIVHDLKAPLQAVLGYAELLQERVKSDPKTEKFSRQISRAGERMHGMVLDVLKIEQGVNAQLIAVCAPVDVAALFAEVVESVRGPARASGHEVSVVCDLSAPMSGDEDLLRRTLENLLQNALQYTPPCAIEVRATRAEGAVTFQVCDQGPGVAAEARERIFDPQVRLSGEPSAKNQGLGLAFCRLAAQAHGGQIWVEDNDPQGSRFCVSIPQPMRADRAGAE